jgi:hypothetical protein
LAAFFCTRWANNTAKSTAAMTISALPLNLKCKRCGAPFSDQRKRRGRHKGFCSEACRVADRKQRLQRYRQEGRYQVAWLCAVCGGEYESAQSTQTCSQECANTLLGWNVRAAAHKRKALGDLFDGVYESSADEGGR